MQHDDTSIAFIRDTQIEIFEAARHDLQLSIPKIAEQAKLSVPTVNAWAQGRNVLSLWGVKKLLRVKGLAPLLSRLFGPEEYALVGIVAGLDLDGLAEGFAEFLRQKNAAHHPASENGTEIGPGEERALKSTVVRLPIMGVVNA